MFRLFFLLYGKDKHWLSILALIFAMVCLYHLPEDSLPEFTSNYTKPLQIVQTRLEEEKSLTDAIKNKLFELYELERKESVTRTFSLSQTEYVAILTEKSSVLEELNALLPDDALQNTDLLDRELRYYTYALTHHVDLLGHEDVFRRLLMVVNLIVYNGIFMAFILMVSNYLQKSTQQKAIFQKVKFLIRHYQLKQFLFYIVMGFGLHFLTFMFVLSLLGLQGGISIFQLPICYIKNGDWQVTNLFNYSCFLFLFNLLILCSVYQMIRLLIVFKFDLTMILLFFGTSLLPLFIQEPVLNYLPTVPLYSLYTFSPNLAYASYSLPEAIVFNGIIYLFSTILIKYIRNYRHVEI